MFPRTLALDHGEKRIGIAVSDLLGFTAQGVATLEYKSQEEAFRRIFEFLKEYEAKQILIGLPLDGEGEEGKQAKKVRRFGEDLQKYLVQQKMEIPMVWWDESLTTQEAEEILIGEADLSRKKRKKVIDKMAATLLLKSYMEAHC